MSQQGRKDYRFMPSLMGDGTDTLFIYLSQYGICASTALSVYDNLSSNKTQKRNTKRIPDTKANVSL